MGSPRAPECSGEAVAACVHERRVFRHVCTATPSGSDSEATSEENSPRDRARAHHERPSTPSPQGQTHTSAAMGSPLGSPSSPPPPPPPPGSPPPLYDLSYMQSTTKDKYADAPPLKAPGCCSTHCELELCRGASARASLRALLMRMPRVPEVTDATEAVIVRELMDAAEPVPSDRVLLHADQVASPARTVCYMAHR